MATLTPDIDEDVLDPELLAECEAYDAMGDDRGAYTRQAQLDLISKLICDKRAEAIAERKTSGLEESWLRAEEAYIGMDDANRAEFVGKRWAKPINMDMPLVENGLPTTHGRSNVYVPVPARYVDAGSAKLAEILLPPDDKSFSVEPTPVPELIDALKNTEQVVKNGVPLFRDAKPEELAQLNPPPVGQQPASPLAAPQPPPQVTPPGQEGQGAAPAPGNKPGVPLTYRDLAQEAIDRARDCATKAEKRMHDWLVEANDTAEVRKIIFDAAKVGVGIEKGPFPVLRTAMSVSKGPDGTVKIVRSSKVKPGFKRIDAWNFYPDPACGENIQDGDFTFEKDRLTPRRVRALKKEPGYIPSQIDRVIAEGPQRRNLDTVKPGDMNVLKDTAFDVWHYYGVLTREEMRVINPQETLDDALDEIHAQVTLINDHVVRAVMNPLDSGKFPYMAMPWRRREGSWAGVGIPEQAQVAGRIINSATRALLDNAGVSAGIQLVMEKGSVTPADGLWNITRNKIWFKTDASISDDVRKAFAAIEFPNVGEALMALIEYGFRLYEESTNIPLITQGQSGDTTPETLGATQLQNNNANQLLRDIGYLFDDTVTEPKMTMLYEWLLLDADVPDDEKGDWQLNCHGSTALVERAIQDETIAKLAGVVKDREFGIDPRKWMKEYLQSKRLDARRFQYTPEEQEKIDAQPPPVAPQVQAAQVRAEIDKMKLEVQQQIALAKAELDKIKVKSDTDRDTIYVQAETERTRNEHEAKMAEITARTNLAMLDYANKRGMALEQVKAELAMTTMKLQVQRELAAEDRAAEALTPPTEPPGRAKPGQSYQA